MRRALPLLLAAAVPSCARAQGLVDQGQPAPAAPAPSAPAGAASAEGRQRSLRKLLEVAGPMAREWSPGAVLYSAYGRGPRNQERWEPETWGLIFGDPKTRDGYFQIEFRDGAIYSREGVKAGVKMVEQFKNGQFDSREAAFARWEGADYARCRPVLASFVDMPVLEKVILDRRLPSDSMGQYGFSLFRPVDERCDGLGRKSLFLREKPLGYPLLKRTLWTIHTMEGVVYVDARTGKVVRSRPYGQ